MGGRGFRLVAASVTFVLIVAACGKDRDSSSPTTPPPTAAPTTAAPATTAAPTGSTAVGTDETTTPSTEPAPEVPMFGDAAWPCGPAGTPNTDTGSEVGVTADSVTLAEGDDAGSPLSP